MLKKCKYFFLLTAVLCLVSVSGAEAVDRHKVYLNTIGGFCGSYIYTSYAYIGATADAFTKDIYTPAQVKVMMEETVGILDNLMSLLASVRNTNVAPSDRQFIDSMVEVLELLKIEARALATFTQTRKQDDVQRYDRAREEAWPKIKKILGIN